LKTLFPDVEIQIDPLMTRKKNFYSGLIFDFWAEDGSGRLHSVGGGGRYDQLFEHFAQPLPAAGFMIRDPNTAGVAGSSHVSGENNDTSSVRGQRAPIRIALPKGRLQKWGIDVFKLVGVEPLENPDSTRKLAIRSVCGGYEFLFVKNADVVSYVERGIADMALAGSDVIDEEPNTLLRPVTFEFGKCRICLAGQPQNAFSTEQIQRARIATKYPNQALRLLRDKGIDAEIIPLQGSVELASVISFCDAIVDLVETGKTLKENNLVIYDELTQTRVQLIMSRAYFVESSHQFRHWLKCWQSDSSIAKQHFELKASEPDVHNSHFEKLK
jgi:ATP phosphoribosyltransferase